MRGVFTIGIAGVLVAISLGMPWALRHHAQLELRARENALESQSAGLSHLIEENQGLRDLIANSSAALSEEQVRELLRLRNEKHWLGDQTNRLARLLEVENQRGARRESDASLSTELSPDEIVAELSVEMIVAMKRILPLLETALQNYASAHTNQLPGGFSDLGSYFPADAGKRMAGLQTFTFVREEHLKQNEALTLPPGETLLLRGDVGRLSADGRPGEGSEVRIYGFSDGRVVEVSSEDGKFDDWEKQHLHSSPAGTEDKIYLEAEGKARDRANIQELGASVGISAEDASRFFDRLKEQENTLGPKFAEMRKRLTGSPEEQEKQIRAAAEQELTRLATEALGDKGAALARKLAERR